MITRDATSASFPLSDRQEHYRLRAVQTIAGESALRQDSSGRPVGGGDAPSPDDAREWRALRLSARHATAAPSPRDSRATCALPTSAFAGEGSAMANVAYDGSATANGPASVTPEAAGSS